MSWLANFRTVASKQGRAIAGLSMGGYGAVWLAQDRPDLFASVASFSGAVDLGDLGTRAVVTEQSLQYGLAFNGVNSPGQNVAAGIVLIVAVGFDTWNRRRGRS